MNKRFAWGLGISIVVTLASVGGCKGSDAPRLSRKGEACQVSADCLAGLSCILVPGSGGGMCVTGEFNVPQTTKDCVLTHCDQPIDCCPTLSPSQVQACAQYQALCADAGPLSGDCQTYNELCQCDTAKLSCDDGQCRVLCTADLDCSGGKCSGGRCVGCVADTDCLTGETCVAGVCTPPCQTDGDCPVFERCNAGKCTDSGCVDDRECIAATRNVEATCGTDGKCIVPCQTDLECGSPKPTSTDPEGYNFYSCINNQCTYVGCKSDKECELYFISAGVPYTDAGYSVFGDKSHAVCKDTTTTNGNTVPAH